MTTAANTQRRPMVPNRAVEAMDGLAAGRRDREHCYTQADVAWYQQVAWDNLRDWRGRPTHYLSGYLDGISGR